MAENMGKWPSGHDQMAKIRPSNGCGGQAITTEAQFEYDRHGYEGYLGNVGLLSTPHCVKIKRSETIVAGLSCIVETVEKFL